MNVLFQQKNNVLIITLFAGTMALSAPHFNMFGLISIKAWIVVLPLFLISVNRSSDTRRFGITEYLLIALSVIVVVSYVANGFGWREFRLLVALAIGITVAIDLSVGSNSAKTARLVHRGVAYSGLILFPLALLIFFLFQFDIIEGFKLFAGLEVHTSAYGDRRISGFSEPNTWAIHTLVIGFGGATYFWSQRQKILFLLVTGIALLNLLLTFSRMGYLAFGVSVVLLSTIVLFTRPRAINFQLKTWLVGAVVVAIPLLMVIVLASSSTNIANRFTISDAVSKFGTQRGPLWGDRIDSIRDSAVVGNGLGFVPATSSQPSAHNAYLQIGSETGILSAILLFILCGYPIYKLVNRTIRSQAQTSPMLIWLVGSNIAVFLAMITLNFQYDIVLWVILGLSFAYLKSGDSHARLS